MIHYDLSIKAIWRSIGVIFLSVGLVSMPGEWWAKLLIWFGIAILTDIISMGGS